jgi:hypothetical protein
MHFALGSPFALYKLFTKVSFKQPLERLTVASLVASHLVNGIVDRIEVLAKPAFAEKVRGTRIFHQSIATRLVRLSIKKQTS